MSNSVSGLSAQHRQEARELVVKAARLGLKNAANLTYTQGSSRWDGINKDLKAYRGECPHFADCSAFATWCLWNGLSHFGVRDTVNGTNFKYGYTGTQVKHGKQVRHRENMLWGDLVHYGDPEGRTGHVAVYVGGGMVISFGGEPGPRLLPWDYRPVSQVRRYI